MNIIALTGNNVREIDLRYNQSGTAFANGTIAVRRDFKNQAGEYETDFFFFKAIGKQAETLANYINKGDKFGITGKLQNRVWEKDDGTKQTITEVIVSGFDFPNKPQNGQNQPPNNPPNTNTAGRNQNSNSGQNGGYNNNDPFAGGSIDIDPDELPF